MLQGSTPKRFSHILTRSIPWIMVWTWCCCLWLGMSGWTASAQAKPLLTASGPKTDTKKPLSYQIRWVPLSQWQTLVRQAPLGWMVRYQDWQKQWTELQTWLTHPAQKAETLSVRWQSMAVTGQWEHPFLRLNLVFSLRLLASGWHRLQLPIQHIHVANVQFRGLTGSVVRAKHGFEIWVQGPTQGELIVAGGTFVTKSPRGNLVSFSVPAVPVSSVSLKLPPQQEVQFHSPGLQVKTSNKQTLIWGGLEKHGRVSFLFRKAETATPKQAAWSGKIDTLYHLQPNLQWIYGQVRIYPKIANARQFTIKIPEGFRLFDFSAPKHIDFVYQEKQSQVLVRVLHWKQQDVLSLRLQCVRQGTVKDSFVAAPFALVGAYAQTGKLSVLVDRRLRHQLRVLQDVRQIPWFRPASVSSLDAGLQFVYWRGQSSVELGIRPVVPVITADYHARLDVLPRQVRAQIRCTLRMKEGAVYRLAGRLSPEWTLFSILDAQGKELVYGHRNQQWWLVLPKRWVAGQTHTLTLVVLRQVVLPTQGAVRFQLPALQLDGVQPEQGKLSVIWPWYYRMTMQKSRSLLPLFGAPRSHVQQKTFQLDWNLKQFHLNETVTLTRRTAHVDVSAVTDYRWKADWMQGSIHLQGEVREAGVRHLSVVLSDWPTNMEPPPIAVQNNRVVKVISRTSKTGQTVWVLHLAREHFGKVSMSAHFQWQKPSKSLTLSLPLVRSAGTQLMRSYTTVAVADNTEIVSIAQGLEAIDPLEIPAIASRKKSTNSPLYAYRMLSQPTTQLQLNLQTHPMQKLQDVVVRSMAVVASAQTEGRLRMQVSYHLWTRGNGYLAIQLPPQSELWSVVRDGQGIKPLLHKNQIQVVFQKQIHSGLHQVSVVYERQGVALPQTRGALELFLPRIDAPIQQSTYHLYLPKSHRPVQINASLPAYDTVQPKAVLAQVFFSLRRQMGLMTMAFWALVILILWWLRFWLWRTAVAILRFFMGVIWAWRKGLLWTSVFVVGLAVLVVTWNFLIPVSRKYSPSFKRYSREDAPSPRFAQPKFAPQKWPAGPMSSSTPVPASPPMDQKPTEPGSTDGKAIRHNEFQFGAKLEKKGELGGKQQALLPPVEESVHRESQRTPRPPEKPQATQQQIPPQVVSQQETPPDLARKKSGDKEGDLSRSKDRLADKDDHRGLEDAEKEKKPTLTIVSGKRGPIGATDSPVVLKVPPVVVTKPKTLVETGIRDIDARMVAGIRSLSFSPPTQGWQVSVTGLGVPSIFRVAVYHESWLRFWLLTSVLLSFLFWLWLGMSMPDRRVLLFWGGILLSTSAAMLLGGMLRLVANTIQLGILGAGVMYVLASVFQSIQTAQGSGRALLVLFFLFAGSGLHSSAYADKPLPIPSLRSIDSSVSVAPSTVERSCRDRLLQQLALEQGRVFPLFVPYATGKQQSWSLAPQQPVFVPGHWWEWMQQKKYTLCHKLPKQARSWLYAHYEISVDGNQHVTGIARYIIHTLKPGWYPIALGLRGMKVIEARHQNLPVSLRYHNHQYQILLQGAGSHRVEVSFEAPTIRERRELQLSLAAAVGATMQIQIKGDWQILGQGMEAWGASVQRFKQHTRWFAMLGNTNQFHVTWRPLQQEGQVEEEMVSLSTQTVVSLLEHVLRVRSRFQFSSRYRRNDRYRFLLPSGVLLEKVTGTALRNWHLEEAASGQRSLVILLEQPVQHATLELHTVLLRKKKEDVLDVPLVEPQGVGRQSGWLGIQSSRALSWSLRQSRYLERRPLADWKEEVQAWGGAVEEAFAYQHRPTMQIAVKPQPDTRQLTVSHHLLLTKQQIHLESNLHIQGQGLPTFSVSLLVSPFLQIQDIRTIQGSSVRQIWFAGEEKGLRRLQIELDRPITSQQILQLKATMSMQKASLSIPVVVPEQKQPWQGTFLISALGDMAVVSENMEHLEPAEVSHLTSTSQVIRDTRVFHTRLAYRFQQTYQGKLSWQAIVSKIKSQVWLHAHTGQNQQWLRAVLSFTATEAGVRSFSFSVPTEFANRMEWVEKGSLHTDTSTLPGGRTLYQFKSIHLQKSLQVAFRMRWRLPLSQDIVIPTIRTEDVVQSETLLALSTPPSIQLQMKKAKQQSLFPLDPDEFPMESIDRLIASLGEAADHDEIPIVATFRTRQQDWSFQVPREVLQSDVAIQTQIETARLDTVVSRQGDLWTQVQYTLRSAGLQFLHIKLPPKAQLWDVRVDHRTIRPSQKQGMTLIPLPPRQTSDLAYTVTLLYAHGVSLPTWLGTIQPEAPQVANITIAQTFWNVFLPKTLRISSIDGNMEETVSLHLTYHELQNELGFYRKLENMSQVGKESSRKRALDNLEQQWNRLQNIVKMGSGAHSVDFLRTPAASPATPMPLNKKTKQKAQDLQQKMRQLQDTLFNLEKRRKQLEMRNRKQEMQQRYQQNKQHYQQQLRYNRGQQLQPPRPTRRYRRYRQKNYRYPSSPIQRKGSFLWTPSRPSIHPLSPEHQGGGSIYRPAPTSGKPCFVPLATQTRNPTGSLLTMTQAGLQYSFVSVGGSPKLQLQVYRRDRMYSLVDWSVWIALLLVLLLAWKRRWFSAS